jgi:deoxyribonuclease V
MIVSLDTYYFDTHSTTAVVCFKDWQSAESFDEWCVNTHCNPSAYVPGKFFQRELPSLLNAIALLRESPDILIVDGYVWLDGNQRPGLGAMLYEAIFQKIPVVGVAKSRFKGAPATEVFRGASKKPIYVTSVGCESDPAPLVASMHGNHRIPSLIKRTDFLSRTGEARLFDGTANGI